MATYAIGDVQGCAATLQRLLDLVPADFARDRIWFVGDLVNRGPSSLQALRTIRALGETAVTVLGNHDLHLLARAAGVASAKRRDTLDDVLTAPDRDDLLAWLRTRPLVHRTNGFTLVHAGLAPAWSSADAERRARRAEAVLAGPAHREFLAAYARHGMHGAAADAAVLTGIRVVDAAGDPDSRFKGAPAEAPRGSVPWFRAPARRSRGEAIVFGHWAALGLHVTPDAIGLDTGCVWGGRLTAMRLEDRRTWSVPLADPADC